MSRPPISKKQAAQPTFGPNLTVYWDDENDRPDPVAAGDWEDYDVRETAEEFLAGFDRWREISTDPAEADARRAYCEQAARHLVAVFPNARVSVATYAEMLAEDLEGISACVVRHAAKEARRTLKTLPSIAQMIGLCRKEERRRTLQAQVYRAAQADYARCLARGREDAKRIADNLRPMMPEAAEEKVAALHEHFGSYSIGIEIPRDHRTQLEERARLLKLLRIVTGGDAEAVDLLRRVAADLEAAKAIHAAAIDEADDDEWRAVALAYSAAQQAARDAVAEFLDRREKAPVRLPDGSYRAAVVAVGATVFHEKFGQGTVTAVDDDKVDVSFAGHGPRRVLARFLVQREAPQ